ncbi:isopentenyl-diphosphate Delta-isomerase [Sanguibacter sp. A247]|uniref:isopentenyl-diphosphate Delta-isomerase n=1 Tax=unclassified Sanguibacter TaxID=2645534 RepID=UPI003FD7EC5F
MTLVVPALHPGASTTEDRVVLLDADGRAIGTAPREGVHDTHTPLHLAFSCHLTDDSGDLLLSRRALTKRSWPGVWTNAFCGHPRPGEDLLDAVRRHARTELGIDEILDLEVVLPQFRYRAVDAHGTVENEICPVVLARIPGRHPSVELNPREVAETVWVDATDLGRTSITAPWSLSPWAVAQLRELADLEDAL